MPAAVNADDYANGRVGIFFPANNETPDDGNLTGQCVTLVKWFMAEMSNVPRPFAARGDARYVGKNLVAQGHATEVAYADRRAGDIVCMEYGTYGHIYIQLMNGRIFEQNVNWPGVNSKIVDGARVYSARIGSDSESWRHDMHVYRLKTYLGGEIPMFNEGDRVNLNIYFYGEDKGHFKDAVGQDWKNAMYYGVFETLESKNNLKLNEGDRQNINGYLYGKELGRFKAAVGKSWKEGMYFGVFEDSSFKIDALVNKGDVPAINAAFGRTDGDTMVGKTWKMFFYEYASKYAGKADFVQVTDTLYKKKG